MGITRSVNNPANGERRILRPGAGPVASSNTETVVAAGAVLDQWENQGVIKHGVRGDGRIIIPRFLSDPVSPQEGDFWILDDGGAVSLRYRSGGVTYNYTGGSGSSAGSQFVGIPDMVSLRKGAAVRTSSTGKVGLASAGAGSVAAGIYEPLGLLSATVPASPNPPVDDFGIILPGYVIELTSGEINYLTGSAALIPNRVYYLSNVSGKWVLNPDAVGVAAEAAVPLCRALTTTKALVDFSMAVIL